MLHGDFFHIISLSTEGGVTKATLEINAAHKIFQGHFPGQPVVPGVCMMQIMKELTETVYEQPSRMVKADEMKFLAVINPAENNLIQAELKHTVVDEGKITVIGRLFTDSYVHFKLKALFVLRDASNQVHAF
jgi:3-hydroxyacyl-[acyl-carrier-protein] dehydratase